MMLIQFNLCMTGNTSLKSNNRNRFLQSYGKTIKDKSRYYKCIKTN